MLLDWAEMNSFWYCGWTKSRQLNAWRRLPAPCREIPRWSKRNLPVTFSYGLLEVWPGSGQSPDNLLNGVDEKMYRQKRRRHIELAQRQHAMQTISGVQSQAFDYDKEHLYDALIKSTDDYIYVCNMKTNTFRYPPAMVEEFGLPAEIISNAAVVWGAKVHEQDRQAFLESNQEIADGRTDCHSVEYRAKNRHGEWVWLRCRGHLERDEQGRPQLFAGMITNLGRHNKVDHLTGLMNKFAFETEVQRLLETAPEQPLGLMMLGLDEFRHINDLYDRLFGDEVIRIISQKMQTMLPPPLPYIVWTVTNSVLSSAAEAGRRCDGSTVMCRKPWIISRFTRIKSTIVPFRAAVPFHRKTGAVIYN